MLTLNELAMHMQHQAMTCRDHLKLEVEHSLEEVAVEAKSLIGREMDFWPALAESTVREKTRLGYTDHISPTDPLLRKGDLRDSIGTSSEKTFEGVEGVVGSDDRIALYQEVGTSKIPPRPFLASALTRKQPDIHDQLSELAFRSLIPGIR